MIQTLLSLAIAACLRLWRRRTSTLCPPQRPASATLVADSQPRHMLVATSAPCCKGTLGNIDAIGTASAAGHAWRGEFALRCSTRCAVKGPIRSRATSWTRRSRSPVLPKAGLRPERFGSEPLPLVPGLLQKLVCAQSGSGIATNLVCGRSGSGGLLTGVWAVKFRDCTAR